MITRVGDLAMAVCAVGAALLAPLPPLYRYALLFFMAFAYVLGETVRHDRDEEYIAVGGVVYKAVYAQHPGIVNAVYLVFTAGTMALVMGLLPVAAVAGGAAGFTSLSTGVTVSYMSLQSAVSVASLFVCVGAFPSFFALGFYGFPRVRLSLPARVCRQRRRQRVPEPGVPREVIAYLRMLERRVAALEARLEEGGDGRGRLSPELYAALYYGGLG